MDLNANPFRSQSPLSSHQPDTSSRDAPLPETGSPDPFGACGAFCSFGAVAGHDGSGAPLPGIGPHDFSAAVRVPNALPMGSAGAAVRMTFAPQAHASQYVVKACPDAAQAWLASRLFGALGLATPTAVLVQGCSQMFDGTHAPERIYLATTYLPVYENLGDWLEGDATWRVIDGAHDDEAGTLRMARDGARDAARKMAGVLAQSGGIPFHALSGEAAQDYADALRARNAMRGVLCGALPDVYQCALERQYIAALWLCNWDLCNVFMENVGVWRDKNDLPSMMTIDFDACLDLGFQDMQKHEAFDVAIRQRRTLASLPAPMTVFRREAAGFDATLADGALADLTQFPYGEHYAPFVRRLATLDGAASNKAVLSELKDPTGVRALTAEMAYRLGQISTQELRCWVASAREVASRESSGTAVRFRAPEAFANHLLTRRDSLVRLLGGIWVAQAWARLYPMRARAIDAQQAPFSHPSAA